MLQNIDPDSGRRTDPHADGGRIRSFFWACWALFPRCQYPDTMRGDELLIQLNEKFFAAAAHDFMKSIVLSLDKDTLENFVRNGKLLGTQLWWWRRKPTMNSMLPFNHGGRRPWKITP